MEATTREPLFLFVFIPTLVLPKDATTIRPEDVPSAIEGLEVFVDSARRFVQGYTLTEQHEEQNGGVDYGARDAACCLHADVASFAVACCEVLATGTPRPWRVCHEEAAEDFLRGVSLLPIRSDSRIDMETQRALTAAAWAYAQHEERRVFAERASA